MKAPNPFKSHRDNVRRGRRTLRLTEWVTELAVPVGVFKAVQLVYEAAYNTFLEVKHAASVALGVLHDSCDSLNNEIRGVGLTIKLVDRGRRTSQMYQQYFKNGYGVELKTNPEEALHISSGLVTLLETEPNQELRARRERLQAAREKLVAAIAVHSTAVDVVHNERKRLAEQAVAWVNAYSKFYFDSRYILPSLRDKVETWFKVKGRLPSEGDEDSGDDAPADDGGASSAPGPVETLS